jgi:2-succinyl-5-enolpyruvyl-6-hydroxy-3-cyclohexene-1-carboxylate synthase
MDSSAARPPKRMRFYHNRGASGIDGIISTAAGIAISSRRQTYLMIGDISFYYDINALWLLKKYKIPLVVFVWNNGGGKIFNHLPVAHYKEICREYFQTPVEIDTKKIVEGFGGKYVKVSKKSELLNCKKIMLRSKAFCVIELMIHNSASDRQKKEFQNTLLHKLLD